MFRTFRHRKGLVLNAQNMRAFSNRFDMGVCSWVPVIIVSIVLSQLGKGDPKQKCS